MHTISTANQHYFTPNLTKVKHYKQNHLENLTTYFNRVGATHNPNSTIQPKPYRQVFTHENDRRNHISYNLTRKLFNRHKNSWSTATESSLDSESKSISLSSLESLRSLSPKVDSEPLDEERSESKEMQDDKDWKTLCDDDIEFLINNTGFNMEQIKRWHKDFLKKCPSGCITSSQFTAYYSQLLPDELSPTGRAEILEKLFKLFDIDGDGFLDFSEFLVSFWIRCKAPIREKYTWIFNMLDNDRNGYLCFAEIRSALILCLNVDDLDEFLGVLNKKRLQTCKSIDCLNYHYHHQPSSGIHTDSDCDDSAFTANTMVKPNKKYNLYSRTSKLVDDKLDEAILLLYSIVEENQTKQQQFSLSGTSLNKSCHSIDSLDSLSSGESVKRRVQLNRSAFLDLCERFKLFRKMLIPINYFYDENLKFV